MRYRKLIWSEIKFDKTDAQKRAEAERIMREIARETELQRIKYEDMQRRALRELGL